MVRKITPAWIATSLSAAALVAGACDRDDAPASPEEHDQKEHLEVEEDSTAEKPADETTRAFTWTADDPDLEWGPCPEYMPEGCGIAVLQGDPAEPNADVFFRLAASTSVPSHWHTSNERMVLVSGILTVDYDGQDPVELEPGTYAFGPAGLAHETHCADGADCVLFIAFEEPVDAPSVADEAPMSSDTEASVASADEVEWGDCPAFMPEGCGLAVLQGDPAGKNADVFFKLAPGTMVPNHWHTSAERMVLVSGEMTVDYEGQEPVSLAAGTYAYGPAKLPHETSCAQGETCVLFIAFEEPIDAHTVD